MAILKQKAHDYAAALEWAERGLVVYGARCLRPEAVADLQNRAEKMKAKAASAPADGAR